MKTSNIILLIIFSTILIVSISLVSVYSKKKDDHEKDPSQPKDPQKLKEIQSVVIGSSVSTAVSALAVILIMYFSFRVNNIERKKYNNIY